MSAAIVYAGAVGSPLEVSSRQLSSPLASSGTIPASAADKARETLTGLSPIGRRPPLLSYNSTDTVSTRSTSFSASPSDPDTFYSGTPIMAGPATQQGFQLYEHYPTNPIYESQEPLLVSGLVSVEDNSIEAKTSADPTTSSLGPQASQAESEGEADASATDDKSFSQTFYDVNKVKHRRRTTAAQLQVLDSYFQESPKPNMETRRQISSKLGMTLREVQVWFQNRRAKQKKIELRAAVATDRALSAPILSPTTLTSVSRNPFPSQSDHRAPVEAPVPSYNPASSFGNIQRSLPLAPAYSTQQTSDAFSQPYASTDYQAQVPRQHQQMTYFPNVTSNLNSLGPALQYPLDERAWSPRSYNASTQHHFNTNNGNILGWGSSQSGSFGQSAHNQSDSVSPASSRSSSQDLTSQRRGSTVPPALSNLSGLSIMPASSQHSPSETTASYFQGVSLAPATLPLDANASFSSMYPQGANTYAAYQTNIAQPSYSSESYVQSTISPTGPVFPTLSPTSTFFPANTAYSSTLGLMQSYAPTPTTIDLNAQSSLSMSQTALPRAGGNSQIPEVQDATRFGPLYSAPPTSMVLNGNLAARRQSMVSLPMNAINTSSAPVLPQSYEGSPPPLAGAFGNLVDEAVLPIRRASTSVINSIPHQRHASTFQPIAPRPSAREKPPIPNSGGSTFTSSSINSTGASRRDEANSMNHNGNRTSIDEGPILGGLQRGSIASKRNRSPTSPLCQPYPHPTQPRKNSTIDTVQDFNSTH